MSAVVVNLCGRKSAKPQANGPHQPGAFSGELLAVLAALSQADFIHVENGIRANLRMSGLVVEGASADVIPLPFLTGRA